MTDFDLSALDRVDLEVLVWLAPFWQRVHEFLVRLREEDDER